MVGCRWISQTWSGEHLHQTIYNIYLLTTPILQNKAINFDYRWDVFIKIGDTTSENNFIRVSRGGTSTMHKYQLSSLHLGYVPFVIHVSGYWNSNDNLETTWCVKLHYFNSHYIFDEILRLQWNVSHQNNLMVMVFIVRIMTFVKLVSLLNRFDTRSTKWICLLLFLDILSKSVTKPSTK